MAGDETLMLTERKKTSKEKKSREKKESDGFIRLLWVLVVVTLFVTLLLPLLGTFIGIVITACIAAGLSIAGYPLIGVALSGMGAAFIFFALLMLLAKFLFEKKW